MAATNEELIAKVVDKLTAMRFEMDAEERRVLDELIIRGPETTAHAMEPDSEMVRRVVFKDDKYRVFTP
jgi:hypothetical protein